MANIELAMLTGSSLGGNQSRDEQFRSDRVSEGRFAGVLAGQEDRGEIDSEIEPVAPVKQDRKETVKVKPEESNKKDEQSQIGDDDTEKDTDKKEVEGLFQGLAFQEASPEEVLFGKISLIEELSQIVEVEGTDSGNSGHRAQFAGLSENGGDLSPQNNLLSGIQIGNEKSSDLPVVDQVLGVHAEVVGESQLNDNDKLFLGSEGNTGVVKDSENVTLVDSIINTKGRLEPGADDSLDESNKKSDSSVILNDESSFTSSGKEIISGLESVKVKDFVADSSDLKQNQSQPSVDLTELINQPQKSGIESSSEVASAKSSIASGGVVVDIPEEVQIQIKNELAATVAGAESEDRGTRLGRGLRQASLSGSEVGTVHLQGRARESQSIFAQGEQNMRNFSDSEIEAGAGEKLSFSETSKKIFAEEFNLSTSTQVGVKEKSDLGQNLSRSNEMVIGNLETGKDGLVKNSGDTISTKPLPVSDDNLMDQIQTGLTRQVKARQTVTINLWPESMGKVGVKLVLRDQQLAATFMVEQSDVKDAMLRKLDGLRDSLALRGIDVKEIDIKVSPIKSGDGPSVTVGDQQQDSADAWQQYQQDGFSRYDSAFANPDGTESGDEETILLAENLSEEIALTAAQGDVPGTLNIMA